MGLLLERPRQRLHRLAKTIGHDHARGLEAIFRRVFQKPLAVLILSRSAPEYFFPECQHFRIEASCGGCHL